MFEKFQQKSKKKIRFFERKLYLRMRRQWIDYELIKIQRNIVRVRKFYVRTKKTKFVPILYYFNKKKQNFDINYFYKTLKEKNSRKFLVKTKFCKKIFLFNLFVNNKFKVNKNFLFIRSE